MKNHCGESVGFVVSAAGDFVYAKFSKINIIIRPSRYFYRQV